MPGKLRLAAIAKLMTVCSAMALGAWSTEPLQQVMTAGPVVALSPEKCNPQYDSSNAAHMLTLGEVEQVVIGDGAMRLTARIDTGATTTSFGVNQSRLFRRNGDYWVSFNVVDPLSNAVREFERPLVRQAHIKRHQAPSEQRYVVSMPLAVGSLCRVIEITLSNRDKFQYPVLVGRNFLHGHATVDVSRQFVAWDGPVK